MQYQHTKRELEMAELIEGSERDRRRLAELLDGIRVGPGVDAMADGMREAVWADVRSRIRRRGIRMRIVRYAAAAAVMAGVVCGSWFMGGRRTESRLVAAAQPVSVSTPLGVKSDVVLPDGSRVRLRPGEQGFFERTSGLLSLRRVNVEQVLSWQEDRLYFRAEPLASIARSLERQFNVDITIPDERLRRICFTGEFVDGENIHEIMRIISADSRILCRSRKNHFELYRNR